MPDIYKNSVSYHDYRIEKLKDPAHAAGYLEAVWEESPELFLSALQDVAEARRLTPSISALESVLASLSVQLAMIRHHSR
jgi:hypothetical protein